MFFMVPFTLAILLLWLVTGKLIVGKIIGIIWLPITLLVVFVSTLQLLFEKRKMERGDIYGGYIIDRSKYPGKQADWQYNHFRFEITPQHDFRLHLTEEARVTRTIAGRVVFLEAYQQPRIIMQVDSPRYHLVATNPTLYRETWSFYYVFDSPKFGNVFFKKGPWVPLSN